MTTDGGAGAPNRAGDDPARPRIGEIEFWCPLHLECWMARRAAPGLVVRYTGMGPKRASAFASARSAASLRLGSRQPSTVVLGLGGALHGDLQPGTVVVGDEVCALLETPAGRRPRGNRATEGTICGASMIREFPASAKVANCLRSAGLPVFLGRLVSASRTVTGERRRHLAADGLLAVDMESWWLAGTRPPPLSIIRVILDSPGAELACPSLPFRLRRCLRTVRDVAAVLAKGAL